MVVFHNLRGLYFQGACKSEGLSPDESHVFPIGGETAQPQYVNSMNIATFIASCICKLLGLIRKLITNY